MTHSHMASGSGKKENDAHVDVNNPYLHSAGHESSEEALSMQINTLQNELSKVVGVPILMNVYVCVCVCVCVYVCVCVCVCVCHIYHI